MKTLKFLIWPTISGILAALLIITNFPGLLGTQPEPVAPPKSESLPSLPIPQPAARGPAGPVSYSEAVKKAAPAVVNIYSTKIVVRQVHPLENHPFFKKFFQENSEPKRKRILSSLGSGVLVHTQGIILTNHHVIADADEVLVALQDGREAQAQVVGKDPETDLAVLKINLDNLPAITMRVEPPLEIGDVVLAIGNPFNVGQTVTMGIISGTGRDSIGLSTYEDYIQTDAAINVGNSGGALIDPWGNLIGINTANLDPQTGSEGIGFAIPVKLAMKVAQDILDHGMVIRGWLGIEVQPLTLRIANEYKLNHLNGFLITNIFKNEPAHKAGLRPGDIVTHINDEPVVKARQAMEDISEMPPGTAIEIMFVRNNKIMHTEAIIGERPKQQSNN